MKITAQRRLALLAGLLLLASIVLATGIQTAQAMIDMGGWSVSAVTAPAATQGRGGFDAAHFTPPQPQGLTTAQAHAHGVGRYHPAANVSAAQAAASGTSSTSVWIAVGSAAAALIVGIAVWALVRRRRRPGGRPSAAYCARHPDDALCTTA